MLRRWTWLNEQPLFGSSNITPIVVPLLKDNMDDETVGTWFYHSNKDAINREALFREPEKHLAVDGRCIERSQRTISASCLTGSETCS